MLVYLKNLQSCYPRGENRVVLQLWNGNKEIIFLGLKLLFLFSFCVTVFHGDVYCVRILRGSVACMVSLLLAGSPEDPVLDWCRYLPGNAGESSFLCRVPEHPLHGRIRWVAVAFCTLTGGAARMPYATLG